tara:strand:+ start:6239 stop:6649 length:411 start_codon:yes stop_codon:yes gene_type:complete
MFKRIILFGFGALVSIFFLSLGPENRLKTTFYAYIDYFDINKRVIYHLKKDGVLFSDKAECQILYFEINKLNILKVLDGGKVNFSKSDKKKKPCQLYLIENQMSDNFYEVLFEFCPESKKVSVLDVMLNSEEYNCN